MSSQIKVYRISLNEIVSIAQYKQIYTNIHFTQTHIQTHFSLAVTVIVAGNVIGDPSSNPGRGCLYFTWH